MAVGGVKAGQTVIVGGQGEVAGTAQIPTAAPAQAPASAPRDLSDVATQWAAQNAATPSAAVLPSMSLGAATLTFKSLDAPGVLSPEAAVLTPMVLTGLKPNTPHEVTLARPDKWDPTNALVRTETITSNAKGEILLGEQDVRTVAQEASLTADEQHAAETLQTRPLTQAERLAAATIFSKLGVDTPVETLRQTQPELAEKLSAENAPNSLRIVATEVGAPETRHGFERLFTAMPEGTRVEPSIPEIDGFVGDKYLPAGDKSTWKQPVVIWGGSGGFINSDRAKELVTQGHPVLALKYFTYDPQDPAVTSGVLPYLIRQLPLEYFANAIKSFKAEVDAQNVSILGESRGAEAALLVAKHFGEALNITDVVAMRPLDFVVGSKINGPDEPNEDEVSSWSLEGKDIPFAALPADKKQFSMAAELGAAAGRGVTANGLPIVEFTDVFNAIKPPAGDAAFIDLSKTNPKLKVHLIGGSDDAMWPAADAVRRLGGQRDGVQVIVSGAGHYNEPGRRSTASAGEVSMTAKGRKVENDIAVQVLDGGTPKMNAFLDVAYGQFVVDALSGGKPSAPLFPEVIRQLNIGK